MIHILPFVCHGSCEEYLPYLVNACVLCVFNECKDSQTHSQKDKEQLLWQRMANSGQYPSTNIKSKWPIMSVEVVKCSSHALLLCDQRVFSTGLVSGL